MTNNNFLIYLAPLRGLTDYLFRNSFECHFGKFDFLLSPFIPSVKGKSVCNSHVRDILPRLNDTARLIPQIIGNNALEIITLACKMHNLGYGTVNWNLGCPFAPVTRKRRGSGLLPHPDMIKSILEQVLNYIPCKLSIKMRLGLDDVHEIEKLMPVLNSFPVTEIIIHPRTGSQMYSGTVNLDAFAACLEASRHTIVYNGDIFTLEDFRKFTDRFAQVKRIMLGRGVLKNPFLLQSIRQGKLFFDRDRLVQFHDDIFSQYSEVLPDPSVLLGRMKGFWFYFSHSFANRGVILKSIRNVSSISDYCDQVQKITQNTQEVFPERI